MNPERWPGEPLHDRLTVAERDELGPYLLRRAQRARARLLFGLNLLEMCAEAESLAVSRQRAEWGRQGAETNADRHRWSRTEAAAAGRRSGLARALRKATRREIPLAMVMG